MKPRSHASVASWITGTLVAFSGVLLTRLVAPQFGEPARAGLAVTGQLTGMAGLFLLALAVRRRLHASASDHRSSP